MSAHSLGWRGGKSCVILLHFLFPHTHTHTRTHAHTHTRTRTHTHITTHAHHHTQVAHLTDTTFRPHLKKKKHGLVMFYAPWCGHCKAAKPEYTAAAELFTDNKKTSFTAVDCTKFDTVCTQYDVTGYPTFLYFNYGKNHAPYQGERSSSGFSEFMANPTAFLHSEL